MRARQGEIIGLAEDDAIDFTTGTPNGVRQIELIRSKAVCAAEVRQGTDVPLPGLVADAIRAHVDGGKPASTACTPCATSMRRSAGRGREHQGRERVPGPRRPGADTAGVRASHAVGSGAGP